MQESQPVITGIGVVSAAGNDSETFWRNTHSGNDSLSPITRFSTDGLRNGRAGVVHLESGETASPATDFVLHAAAEAFRSAGFDTTPPPDTAVVLGTNFGPSSAYQSDSPPGAQRLDAPTRAVVSRWDLAAALTPTLSVSCASGDAAIGFASSLVRSGRTSVALAGGYDELSLFSYAGLSALRAITRDAIRPFDMNRSGTLFGEGAGLVVVESEAHARARGAAPLARILGWSANNDAYHMTAPEPEGRGIRAVISDALADAGTPPENVAYVNAHGTGTKYNDKTETKALHQVFGAHAASLVVSSVKPVFGHGMGAAGSLEVIATVLAMRDSLVPPTINLADPDPECDLDYCAGAAREMNIPCAISNSFGIGGANACLVLKQFQA